MPLEALKYKATCDVVGCGKQLEGTVDQLARSSWQVRLLYGGVPQLVELAQFIRSASNLKRSGGQIVCPQCNVMKHYEKMVKPV